MTNRKVWVWLAGGAILVSMGYSALSPGGLFNAAFAWQPKQLDEHEFVALGTLKTRLIPESSGLATSSSIDDAIWTTNDSGNAAELFLLRTDGKLVARLAVEDAKNLDWEAMSSFSLDGKDFLLVADVGDNLVKRANCQLYIVAEPDLKSVLTATPEVELPKRISVASRRIDFRYDDGPRNCEALGVDADGKNIWLIEKIAMSFSASDAPGVYVLPLPREGVTEPSVAKRIANFPIRNVTGMAFSRDGKHLIIRNYLNAHLYSRDRATPWSEVILKSKPQPVVLPIQRQGESICFSSDSKSLIVTSEFVNQVIWKISLARYTEPTDQSSDQESPSNNTGN